MARQLVVPQLPRSFGNRVFAAVMLDVHWMIYNSLIGGWGEVGVGLFSHVTEIGLKLYQGRFRLDIREHLLSERVVGHWHRLPKEWWGHSPWRCSRTMEMGH